MKNEKMVRTANSKTLEFKSKEEMWKFLFLIKDLLVPYSDEMVRPYVRKDSERAFWMKQGIKINYWTSENLVDILISAEDFKKIESMFKKENLRRGKNKFIFVGYNIKIEA